MLKRVNNILVPSFLNMVFKTWLKKKTCFKNPNNPSCIDIFLTNTPKCFQNTKAIACGLSDCHKMILTVIKMTFQKVKPKEILYRNFKIFDKIRFRTCLKILLKVLMIKPYVFSSSLPVIHNTECNYIMMKLCYVYDVTMFMTCCELYLGQNIYKIQIQIQ